MTSSTYLCMSAQLQLAAQHAAASSTAARSPRPAVCAHATAQHAQHSSTACAAQQHSSMHACVHVACICARSTYICAYMHACKTAHVHIYICMHEHMYMHICMYIVGKQYSTSFSAAVYVLYKYYTRTIDSTVHACVRTHALATALASAIYCGIRTVAIAMH